MLRRAFLLGTTATLASVKAALAVSGMTGTDRVLFGRAPSWVPNPANPPDIAINWKTNQAWRKNGGLTSPASLGITTSRASVKQVVNSGGQWTQVASNVTAMSDLGRSTEEARTNVALQSAALGNAAWGQSQVTVTGGRPAPDGTNNASAIITDGTLSSHNLFNSAGITLSVAVYTFSVFFKPNGFNFAWIGSTNFTNGFSAVYNLTTGAVTLTNNGTGSPTNTASGTVVYPNGWVRCWMQMTCNAAAASTFFSFGPSATGSPSFSGINTISQGNGVSGVDAYWPQCELGSSMSSPITTVGSSVTRAADVTTLTAQTFGSAYSIFEQATPQTPVTFGTDQVLLSVNDNSTNNRAQIGRISATGNANAAVFSGGVSQYNQNGAVWALNTSGKAALATIAGTQRATFNGTLSTGGTGATMPVSPAQLNFGSTPGGTLFANGLAAIDAIWLTSALSNAELQAITT